MLGFRAFAGGVVRAMVPTAAIFAVGLAACLATPGLALAQRPPVIAAASDLSAVLAEVGAQFERDAGQRVDFVFGSSGTLARQIQDGAPFEVFLSADEALIDQLAKAGLARDAGVLYGVGRLVLFAPTGSPLVPREGLDGLAGLLAQGRVTRFAIANPEHAPYGRAAEAALRKHGLWTGLAPHLVLGANVSQAAQFATSGNAVGGLIAYSLALAPGMLGRGVHALISDADHPPLRQRMVLLARAGEVATQFYRYLQQPAARNLFERFGFVVPR